MNKHFLLPLIMGICCLLPLATQAQLVNMEETWQEFLSNKKASNISELVKPDKSQPANYLKYSLIYANTYFCGDNISSTDEMVREIEAIGSATWDKIPGFEERYEVLKEKIKAYKSLDPVWKKFMNKKSSVSRADVEAFPEAKNICERGTLCKYFYMISYDYFCDKDLKNAREIFDDRIRKLTATSFNPKDVEGLGDEVERMDQFWVAHDEMTPAWEAYIETGISLGLVEEMPVIDCYVLPNMKHCILKAAHDLCGVGEDMLKKLKDLQKKSPDPIPSVILEKMDWLENEVSNIKKDVLVLNTYWRKFLQTEKMPEGANFKHFFVCDHESDVKAFLMDGLSNPCDNGPAALDSISKIRKEYKPDLSAETSEKLKKLKGLMETGNGDAEVLNNAWGEFVKSGKLADNVTLSFKYCKKEDEIKAYIIDGTLNLCERGMQRIDNAEEVLDENELDLSSETQAKFNELKEMATKLTAKTEGLKSAWAYLVSNGNVSDNLRYDYDHICDRELDVQAYILDGFTNPCQSGKYALGEIAKVKEKHNPKLSDVTTAQIKKLEDALNNEKKNIANLNKAWADFVPDDKLSGGIDFEFTYCDKISEVKAYIIDGTVNYCEQGKKRLRDIRALQENYLLTLNKEVGDKLAWLEEQVNGEAAKLADVNATWEYFIKVKDLKKIDLAQIKMAEYHCDPVLQIKVWVIAASLIDCDLGKEFMDKINNLKGEKSVIYEKDLEHQVNHLKAHLAKCK